MYAQMILSLVVVFLAASLWVQSDAQSIIVREDFRRGEIVAEIKPGAKIDAVNERNGTTTIERIQGTNFYRLRTPQTAREEKWRKRVERDPDVLSATLNLLVTCPTNVFARATVAFPGDRAEPGQTRPDYVLQPHLFDLLHLNDAQVRSRGAGVTIAVIDTGIDRAHPDVASNLWKDNRQNGEVAVDGIDEDHDGFVDDLFGWDFVDNDNDPTETGGDPAISVAGHGSFIAGLLKLIAPDVRILPIRAFAPDGTSSSFTVAAAIKYAADHGARVINLSFGSPKKSAIVRDAVTYARQKGSVLVAAMGNDGTDIFKQYPANLLDVIGVAAIDTYSRKAVFSNFGNRVSVAAPGVRLISTYPGSGYAMWSGTSFAAPLTAGQAALLLSESPGIDVRRTTEESAVAIDDLNPGFSGKLGKGRINPLAALESIYSSAVPSGNYAHLPLRPATSEGSSRGNAEKTVTGPLQQFRITIWGLTARSTYTLMINGKDISSDALVASSFGALDIELSNRSALEAHSGEIHLDLPSELNPITKIKRVELRGADGTVLDGEFLPIADGAGSDQFVTKRASLSPIEPFAQASGRAIVLVSAKHEELRVEANSLTPGATYGAFADGISLGVGIAQSAATGSGFVRIRVTKSGVSEPQIPSALRPLTNIRLIELRDSSNRVILLGDFLPGGDGS